MISRIGNCDAYVDLVGIAAFTDVAKIVMLRTKLLVAEGDP